MISINENFNNQVVKARCENWLLLYTYMRTSLFENRVGLKKIKIW
jgi:hypothetical protein